MKIEFRKNIPLLLQGDIRMTELGVAKGDFAHQLLQHENVSLIMVDRWGGDRGHGDSEMNYASRQTEFAKDRRVIIKKTFEDAVLDYEDEYFDIVYIDGYAHTGQDGGKTLELWYSKVRSGGVFSGHDYHKAWQPTIDAVDAFTRKHNLEFNITEKDEFPSWYIIKP